jgi:hypothetical protein
VSRLRRVIDGLTTAVTLAAGIAVIWLVGARLGLLPDRHADSARPRPSSYSRGDRVATLSGIDFSRRERTVLIVFRSNCAYCIRGAPFYQELTRLRDTQRRNIGIVAVAPMSDAMAKEFPKLQGWSPDGFVSIQPGSFKVAGVPTIIIVDRSGVVQDIWFGELSETEKSDLVVAAGLASA